MRVLVEYIDDMASVSRWFVVIKRKVTIIKLLKIIDEVYENTGLNYYPQTPDYSKLKKLYQSHLLEAYETNRYN